VQLRRFMMMTAPIRAAFSLYLGALIAACDDASTRSANPTGERDAAMPLPPLPPHDTETQDASMDEVRDPCLAQPGCEPCRFRDVPGTAVIEEISKAPEGVNNCSNSPMLVTFAFIPDAPFDLDGGFLDDGVEMLRGTYSVGSGENPPESCLEPNGIVVGARFPATRKDSIAGTCAPVLLDIHLPAEEICLQQCSTNEGP